MKTRKIFTALLQELEDNKILLLVGPRQVGKTTLLKQLQATVKDKQTFFINLERDSDRRLLDEDPENIFGITLLDKKAEQIIFIDEVQYLQDPSHFLKLLYDEYHETMKLVVSGSSSFYIDQKFKDSLMGRKRFYEMFTLDFEEFLDFKDELDMKKYLATHKTIPLGRKKHLENLFLEYITYGGYPEVVLLSEREKKIQALELLASDYIKKDIYDANIQEIDKFFAILKILAHQTWALVSANEIANTLQIDIKTVDKYLYIMRKSYRISLMKPFWTNIRAELTRRPKVYFFDLGLRNSFLNNFENIHERSDKWDFFENVVRREFGFRYGFDNLKYRRNQNKNEVDLIVKEQKAYEIKFSQRLVKESKYKVFKEKYPEMGLTFITFENFLETIVTKQ